MATMSCCLSCVKSPEFSGNCNSPQLVIEVAALPTTITENCDDSDKILVIIEEIHVRDYSVKLEQDMSNKTMHWTASMWRVQLRILLCASVVVIEFVTALNAPNVHNHIDKDDTDVTGRDYNRYASKYFVSENETYTSDKRIIVEDYFRQSALSPKNSQQQFQHSDVPNETSYASASPANENNESDGMLEKRDKHSVTDEGNVEAQVILDLLDIVRC